MRFFSISLPQDCVTIGVLSNENTNYHINKDGYSYLLQLQLNDSEAVLELDFIWS